MVVMAAIDSMRERIEGKDKIDVARQTFKPVTENWDKHLHLGLTD